MAAAGAFALLLAVAPAHAGNVPVTDNSGSTLTIDLAGEVQAHCGFTTPPAGSATIDLSTAGSLDESFVLDCNTPFRLRVSSQNGQLNLQNPPASAPASFGESDPYDVAVQFTTDLGTVGDATPCHASALTSAAGGCAFFGAASGQGLSSGAGVAIAQQGSAAGQGSLTISWSPPNKVLVAGNYSDTLTIVVEPRT